MARELRQRAERLEEDPERLEAIRRRLQLFAELRRKYGPSLARGPRVREGEPGAPL